MPGLFGAKYHRSEDSFAIRLSGWTKLGMCASVSIVTLFLKHEPALIVLLAAGAALAFSQLRLKVILFLYLAIGVMSAISVGFAALLGHIAAKYHPAFRNYDAFVMLVPFMRVITVMQVLVVTALSTSPQEILINLKSIRLPRFLYLPVLVMLRFVPSFINDLKQINEGLKTRGLRINFVTIMTRPGLTIRCSVIPLIFRAFRASDELAIASELKGVGHLKKTTSFKKNRMGRIDLVTIIISLLLLGTSLFIQSQAPLEQSMMHGMTSSGTGEAPAAGREGGDAK
jgi:energy-coupling factor transport system permease protein